MIVVTDENGYSVEQEVVINITGSNDAPVIASQLEDVFVNIDSEYSDSVAGYFIDVDYEDNLTYSISGSTWVNIDKDTGVITGNSTNQNIGTEVVIVTATDSSGATITGVFNLTVNASIINAIIHTTDDFLLDNLTLHYYKDGVDTGVSSLVEEGGTKFDQSLEFDMVKLSVVDAYQSSLNLMDMFGALDSIGRDIDNYQEHAADINNLDGINLVDMYKVLDDIGQQPQTFDLVR